ncbi:MAG: ATP-binding cassette domain-containing protein [Peptococcaceae bacterium]|nr:ATP-binding cassette domain-containing protein [Peptococcaceae bacterium]
MAIRFTNVCKSFDNLTVLSNFSYTIDSGEFICFFGPSGIGKTTILQLIAGLLLPDAGELKIEEKRIGYVFQEPRLLPWCNVADNIELSLYAIIPDSRQKRLELVNTLLQKVELESFAKYYPAQLSGGMKQRVALARAFAIEPEILLLDEPFSALDHKLKDSLRSYLQDLLSWKPCITIMVTHDLDEAIRLGDKILVIGDRPCRILYEHIIEKPREKRDDLFIFEQTRLIQSFLNTKIN